MMLQMPRLTILAYGYEGMRFSDVKAMLLLQDPQTFDSLFFKDGKNEDLSACEIISYLPFSEFQCVCVPAKISRAPNEKCYRFLVRRLCDW